MRPNHFNTAHAWPRLTWKLRHSNYQTTKYNSFEKRADADASLTDLAVVFAHEKASLCAVCFGILMEPECLKDIQQSNS